MPTNKKETKKREATKGKKPKKWAYKNIRLIQRMFLGYIGRANSVFQRGKINFRINKTDIHINYLNKDIDYGVTIPIKLKSGKEKDEMFALLQEFMVHCFTEFDRKAGDVVSLRELADLLCVNTQRAGKEVVDAIDKIVYNVYEQSGLKKPDIPKNKRRKWMINRLLSI